MLGITIDNELKFKKHIEDFCKKASYKLQYKICKIHHGTLRVVYKEFNKSYGELLQLNNNVSFHQRHLQYLFLEVFKSLMHLNPEFMWSYFNENPIPYDLRRKGIKVFLPPVESFHFGLNSIHFRESILWNNPPSSIKNSQTKNELKVKLKNLGNIHCPCGVCRWDVFIFFNFLKKVFNFFVMYISQVFMYL